MFTSHVNHVVDYELLLAQAMEAETDSKKRTIKDMLQEAGTAIDT